MSSAHVWRLIVDPPATGAWNMAVDESLLESAVTASTPPTLRFYAWAPACLSLGYFQAFAVVDGAACAAAGVDIVRRPTGGRAILHDEDLTYSLSAPLAIFGRAQGVLSTYQRISRGLQTGLAGLGVSVTSASDGSTSQHGPACFDRPSIHELLIDGRKLIGSAQVRRGPALLQHGSLLYRAQPERLIQCLRWPNGQAARGHAEIRDGVGELPAHLRSPAHLIPALVQGFAAEFGVDLQPGELSQAEIARAERLSNQYRSQAWTKRN